VGNGGRADVLAERVYQYCNFTFPGWRIGLGIRLAYCLSDLQVLRVRTHLLTGPKLRFSILRCAIQAASGKTAVAGYPPVLRATDMPTHSVLSHIKGQNAPDSDFESEDAPPNSPPQNCSLQTIPPIVAF
jgi:hypothetical protein